MMVQELVNYFAITIKNILEPQRYKKGSKAPNLLDSMFKAFVINQFNFPVNMKFNLLMHLF